MPAVTPEMPKPTPPRDACFDIFHWWGWVKSELDGICPNCLLNLAEQSPYHNLYPHWTGACHERDA